MNLPRSRPYSVISFQPAFRESLALALLGLMAFSGCGGRGAAPAAEDSVLVSTGTATPDGKARVLRFTQDHFERLRSSQRPTKVIPVRSMMLISKSSRDDAKVEQDSDPKFVKEENRLLIRRGEGTPMITALLGGIPAEHYNEFRVRMKADRGANAVLTWATDMEPSIRRSETITVPIFSDNQFHTYRVPLDGLSARTWAGSVRSISFIPSNLAANIEIELMELWFRPPQSPSRVTIASQTHEAVFGTQIPWEFTVPPGAVFETHFGMPDETWDEKQRAGAARFVITLSGDDANEVVLLDRSLRPKTNEDDRGWIFFQTGLDAYAGQKVRLRFEVKDVGDTRAAAGCWGGPIVFTKSVDSASTPVILISCDTLRADHLSCYGYHRETSPHLDAFAKQSVVFENAITPETWTLPSHVTMLTGLYPKNHGVTPNSNLSEDTITLAEALRDAGYVSGAYIGFTFWLYPWRGFAHGFDLYNTPNWRFRPIYETHALADAWIEAHAVPNTFLFLHNFDVHSKPARQYDGLPYGPDDESFLHFAKEFTNPPTFARPGRDIVDAEAFLLAANRGEIAMTQEEVDYCKALYDDCIRLIDHRLHETFEKLKELGLYERALIIVTADHGEEFGEHGVYGHANVYEPSLRIPLIIKFPNGRFAGTRYPTVVELSDIFPTVLDVLGIAPAGPVDGQSLLRVLDGSAAPKGVGFAQRFTHRTARATDWKLIRTMPDAFELYDLVNDRAERNNVLNSSGAQGRALREAMEQFFQVNPEGWHIAFDTVDPDWRGTLTLSSDGLIEAAELLGGIDVQALARSDRGVTLNLDKLNRDELVLRTVGGSGRVSLNVTSKSPFAVRIGDRSAVTGTNFESVLDSSGGAIPEPSAASADLPTIRVWYVPETGNRSAARELSPEAIEELKALGYTH